MNFSTFIKPTILAASMALAGVAPAAAATVSTFDFAQFSLTADLSSFAGSFVTQSADGFTFGGYEVSVAVPTVINVIDFTLTAKAGYSIESFTFKDYGYFAGTKRTFNVSDDSDVSFTQVTKATSDWSYVASGPELAGIIGYSLLATSGNKGGSYGGSFSVVTTPVPEPESYALFLAGLGLMGAIAKRRTAKQA